METLAALSNPGWAFAISLLLFENDEQSLILPYMFPLWMKPLGNVSESHTTESLGAAR